MKKLLLIAIAATLMAACAKTEKGEKSWELSDYAVELVHNKSHQLIVTNSNVAFSSSDTYVCNVDASGKITGNHIGQAVVTVTDGKISKSCSVSVVPLYDMYEEPVLDWTLEENAIKSKYPNAHWYIRKANAIHKEGLLYNTPKPSTYICEFNFSPETGKLIYVDIAFYKAYLEQARNFLEERYEAMNYGGSRQYFLNSEYTSTATVRIVLFQATTGVGLAGKIGDFYVIRYYNPKVIDF